MEAGLPGHVSLETLLGSGAAAQRHTAEDEDGSEPIGVIDQAQQPAELLWSELWDARWH